MQSQIVVHLVRQTRLNIGASVTLSLSKDASGGMDAVIEDKGLHLAQDKSKKRRCELVVQRHVH